MRYTQTLLVTAMSLAAVFIAFAQPVAAQEVVDSEAVELIVESPEADLDTLPAPDPDPEWYVAPEIPASRRAPQRALTADCPIDSVRSFDPDSVLERVTWYEYDAAGRTVCTTVWVFTPEHARIGESKQEYRFDASGTQIYDATFEWDLETNNWRGVAKAEYVYNASHKIESRIDYIWVDGDWTPNAGYLYTYDNAGREIEYTAFARNAESGLYLPAQHRVREYSAAGRLILEELYDGFINNAWVGTYKKVYDYDTAGNTVLFEYYEGYDNGAWIGSTKEIWEYTSGLNTYYEKSVWSEGVWVNFSKEQWTYNAAGKQTLYEKYDWIDDAWVGTSKELWDYNAAGKQTLNEKYTWVDGAWAGVSKDIADYDEAGRQTLKEKYTWSNGMWTGVSKEVTGYNAGGKKILSEKYTWSNGAWAGTAKEVWEFNASNKQTLHEKYSWANDDWSITLREISDYDAAGNTILIENYSLTNGVFKGTKKEEYAFNASKKKTDTYTYKWMNDEWVYDQWIVTRYDAANNIIESCRYNWKNDAWIGSGSRTLKTFNSAKKVTEQIVQTWSTDAANWVNSTRATTEYEGAKITQEASYSWQNDEWVGVSRSDWHYNSAGLNDTIKTYTPNGTEWVFSSRTVKTYDAEGTNIMTHNATWTDGAWVMSSMTRTDIIKDAAGRQLLNASWTCGSDSVWSGVQKDTAAYSAAGLKLYEAHYASWENNDWVFSYKVEYEYDEADRLVVQQRFDWVSGKWKGHYRDEYGYDEQGRQTMTASYLQWNNTTQTWIGNNKSEYVYASNGQYSQVLIYTWRNDQWQGMFSYMYTYDDAGREIEQIVQRYSNNEWVNSRKYVTAYDGDQLIKENELVWRNDQWIYSSRNEMYYDNDTEAKLRREVLGSWEEETGELISFKDYLYFYDCDVPSYTITFKNYDGATLASVEVKEGRTPEYSGETPAKPTDAEHSYTFTGWSPAIAPATADAVYTAEFTAAAVTYTITWLNEDGTEIDHATLEYGAMPEHADAVKQNTAEFTYTFAGWSPEIVAVAGDASYTAVFNAVKNTYTITWLNEDGTEIDHATLEYGAMPEHADAVKESTAEFTYTFAGWSPEIVAVAGDASYTAVFNAVKNSYTITWLNEDGTEIDHATLEYGTMPEHADAVKESTAEFTYTFAGWSPEIIAVAGDASYSAVFNAVKNSYTVTWLSDDGTEIDHATLEYGTMPEHADAVKESTAEFTYTFAGWSPEIVAVAGDASYTAVFNATKNSYTVLFLDYDGTELGSAVVEYGEAAQAPADPAREGYYFAGWDADFSYVTGDMTITATYKLPDPTSVTNLPTEAQGTKVFIEGKLYILRGGKTYTADGVMVQ